METGRPCTSPCVRRTAAQGPHTETHMRGERLASPSLLQRALGLQATSAMGLWKEGTATEVEPTAEAEIVSKLLM